MGEKGRRTPEEGGTEVGRRAYRDSLRYSRGFSGDSEVQLRNGEEIVTGTNLTSDIFRFLFILPTSLILSHKSYFLTM